MSEMNDSNPVVASESTVLSKYEGNVHDDNSLLERVYIEDGVITKHEFYENGEVTKTIEGRDD